MLPDKKELSEMKEMLAELQELAGANNCDDTALLAELSGLQSETTFLSNLAEILNSED